MKSIYFKKSIVRRKDYSLILPLQAQKMIVFPNAKVNLGLNIVEKRNDGYHNIETVFYPIPLNDILEITEIKGDQSFFSSQGINIPSDGKPNLVERAWQLLHDEYQIPAVDLDLYKNVPIGAGLGGGSADAAFCLTGLNTMFDLNIEHQKLIQIASKLGADCAFFVENKPVYATEKGDQFESIDIDLRGYHMVLIYPNIHVSTPKAYQNVHPKPSETNIKDILKQPISSWKTILKNDFENSVFPQFPLIEACKTELYQKGAIYASMSGSGSSVFGIFDHPVHFETALSVQKWTLEL